MLGQLPYCAQRAHERYAEFPKIERLNSLRPYLVQYELFPPKISDPQTAPIRMEELKGLVRKWKLHHERNFWRNHQSKDEVVNALHRHLRNRKAQREKLARLRDEKARLSGKDRNLSLETGDGYFDGPPSPLKNVFRPPESA